MGVEYVQKDIRELTNINLINHIEDFNLGWHAWAEIGTDLRNDSKHPELIWRSRLSKGF